MVHALRARARSKNERARISFILLACLLTWSKFTLYRLWHAMQNTVAHFQAIDSWHVFQTHQFMLSSFKFKKHQDCNSTLRFNIFHIHHQATWRLRLRSSTQTSRSNNIRIATQRHVPKSTSNVAQLKYINVAFQSTQVWEHINANCHVLSYMPSSASINLRQTSKFQNFHAMQSTDITVILTNNNIWMNLV